MTYLDRIVASIENKTEWWKARANSISASDVSLLAKDTSIGSVIRQKFNGNSFGGNRYTEHGNSREPEIQNWIVEEHGIQGNKFLFHSEPNKRFLATPDGLKEENGSIILAEIKTTKHEFAKIPPRYLRQIYWQQYVLQAEKTLFVWEVHENFKPTTLPQVLWIERDDDAIEILVRRATMVLELMDEQSKNYIDEQESSPWA